MKKWIMLVFVVSMLFSMSGCWWFHHGHRGHGYHDGRGDYDGHRHHDGDRGHGGRR